MILPVQTRTALTFVLLILSLCAYSVPSIYLTSAISVNSNPIVQGQYYTVTAYVHNSGSSGTFDFEADFESTSGAYLTVIQKSCSQYIAAGANATITFNSNAAMAYSAGSYQVSIITSFSSCSGCGTSATCFTPVSGNGYANPLPISVTSAQTCSGWYFSPSSQSVPASGNTYNANIYVTTGSNCSYSLNYSNWITLNSNSQGALNYTVPQNNTGSQRTGYIYGISNGNTVATLTIDQPAMSSGSAPPIPTGLAASGSSPSTVDLSWYAASGATSYDVYDCSGNYIASTSNTNYTLYGLSAGTYYSYRVRATNSYGSSSLTSCVGATTQNSGSAPSTPSGLTASASSSTSISLNWSSSSGTTSYDVYDCNGNYISNTTSTSYLVSGLSSNTYYSYKVRANNSYGSSNLSSCAGATTSSSGTAPPVPTSLSASGSSPSTINLSWNAASSATSYDVYDCGGNYLSNTSSTSYLVSGLVSNTYYSYKVRANNTYGSSNFTSCAGASTPTSGSAPSVPTGLVATAASQSSIGLMWNSANGATSYDVYSCTGSLITSVASTSYTVSGLAASTNYSYKIRANNTYGSSNFTSCASATTQGSSASSQITIKNIINNNSSFPTPLTLWSGSSSQVAQTIKICADGSKATEITFVNNTGVSNSNIQFLIASDPNGNNSAATGYFIHTDYSYSGNTIKARFTHPKYLSSSYNLYRADAINVVDISNSNQLFTMPIKVFRAPVIMVHGLWGNRDSYRSFENYLDNSGSYAPELTFRVDYVQTNAASFITNQYVIPLSINAILSTARSNSYSAGKVDIIAHSMGGLLSRYYIQSSPFQQKQDVHKLITLNTPHSGSQWGNLLTSLTIEGDAARIAAEIVAHLKFSSTIYDGAINDLAVNSFALNYLNSATLNNGIVPSHAIVTTSAVINDDTWYDVAAAVAPLDLMSINALVDYIFCGTTNDLVVSSPSQSGGLPSSAISSFSGQMHLGPYDNPSIRSELMNALNTNSDNSGYFTQSGYAPISIATNFKTDQIDSASLQLQRGSITITSPSHGQTYNPGDVVHVNISSRNGINRLIQIGITPDNSALVDTNISNGIIDYTIPTGTRGTANIVVFGYDANNMIDYDTVMINLVQTASIDSINFYGDTLYVAEGSSASVTIGAYFSDGNRFSVDCDNDMQYQIIDTNTAKSLFKNQVLGKRVGVTSLFATYMGLTKQIPVVVIPKDTTIEIVSSIVPIADNSKETQQLLEVFPNPTTDNLSLKLTEQIGETIFIQVINQMGQLVNSYVDHQLRPEYIKSISLQGNAPGIYYIRVNTSRSNKIAKVLMVK